MNETARDRSPQSLENEIIALTHRLKCLRPALSPSMDGLTPMEAHALVLLFFAPMKSSAASSLPTSHAVCAFRPARYPSS